MRVADDLQLHSVRIGQRQHLFVEALACPLNKHTLLRQALHPVVDGRERHAERRLRHLAHTGLSALCVGPREERQDRAGRTRVIAKVKVVGPRIVEVYGPLYKAKSHDLGIKVKVHLRVRRNRSDVM